MKILVLSDSHGINTNMDKIINNLAAGLDAVIHLGDNTEDINRYRSIYKNIDFYAVKGNCDYSGTDKYEKHFLLSRKKFYFVHGHKLGVKSGLQRLVYSAWENEADICLFGHTHVSQLFVEGGTVFMNPGSVSLPRNGDNPGYGVICLDEKKSYASVVAVKDYGFEVKYSVPL